MTQSIDAEAQATLRAAARRALEVLVVIRDTDADQGIADPDVAEAIDLLKAATRRKAPVRRKPHKARTAVKRPSAQNRWGFQPFEQLRVVRGRLAGAVVRYAGASNATDIYVTHNGSRTTVSAAAVERETLK